jgi:hypothetical protein
MTEKQLREAIRKEIRSQISEMDDKFSKTLSGTARSGLGSAKAKMDAAMAQIEPKEIKGMQKPAQASLIAAFLEKLGFTAKDFNSIKSLVGIELTESQKSNEQMLNENILIDIAQALADFGFNYSSDAIELAAKGDFSAMGNAIDNAMKVPKEAAMLVLSLAGITTSTGVSAKAAKQVVSYVKSKIDAGDVNLKPNVEDLVDATADPTMTEAFKKYNKQKALLEAKRRNSANRKK